MTGSRFITMLSLLAIGLVAGTLSMSRVEGRMLSASGDPTRIAADESRRLALMAQSSALSAPSAVSPLATTITASAPPLAVDPAEALVRADARAKARAGEPFIVTETGDDAQPVASLDLAPGLPGS
ncbi:MAG: hypothetical protein AAGF32_10490, partial [Pseudomonadota bacterium]